jgi:hypothetical protein
LALGFEGGGGDWGEEGEEYGEKEEDQLVNGEWRRRHFVQPVEDSEMEKGKAVESRDLRSRTRRWYMLGGGLYNRNRVFRIF